MMTKDLQMLQSQLKESKEAEARLRNEMQANHAEFQQIRNSLLPKMQEENSRLKFELDQATQTLT